MLDFKIDETKCIQCGLCAKDCPIGIIEMDGIPTIKKENEAHCLQCQHCLAVCPTGALSIAGKSPEDSLVVSGDLPDAQLMAEMIKTRRSVRKYKKESVDKALIHALVETASYAPTGHNDNGVQFTVIDNVDTMTQFRTLVYDAIKEAAEAGAIPEEFSFAAVFQKQWEETGHDGIFRNAPHLVISSASQTDASPKEDALIAMSYFELLANAHGLGTLWNGMVKFAINDISPALRLKIGIPEDHVIGYVMLLGKPAVKYKRAIQSDGVHIKMVDL